jgi:hypothetical protein
VLILRGSTEVPRRGLWLALLDGFLPEPEASNRGKWDQALQKFRDCVTI